MDTDKTPDHGVKVPFDPGWNDPPKIAYNAQITPNKPRNFLNKRVAFPMSGTSSNTVVSSSGSLPPMPSPIPIPTAPKQKPPSIANQQELQINSETALSKVKDILLNILDSSSELGSKSNDIRRRINVMEEMWTSGKLNTQVQVQMQALACALESNNPDKADDIHRALMIDYVSIVGTWMPGVKQLIHHYIAKVELLAIDKE